MAETACRHFSGYKPCGLSERCESSCAYRVIPANRILIVHLGALGAVVRSTTLLAAIRQKYGAAAHITWLTQKPAEQLLKFNAQIDRVLTTERDDLLTLSGLEFDVCLTIDKSTVIGGLQRMFRAQKTYGFCVEAKTGAIVPATPAAQALWQIGLSNHLKFQVNKKPETQLVAEALELPYLRQDYHLPLSPHEIEEAHKRRRAWSQQGQVVVGLNTGCSGAIPYKKLSVQKHRELIMRLQQDVQNIQIVLLGGREDQTRNQQIAYGLNVVQTPTLAGLRDGLLSVEACDLVVSGDSLGMHMAIARKKWTVAWFGPTCAHEIDLFDRGVQVLSQATCGPCWKRSCHKEVMCYDLVEIKALLDGVKKGLTWLTSSSTPHLLATSSSQSRSCVTPSNFIETTI